MEFLEYPKWVGDVIVDTKEEELALTGEVIEEDVGDETEAAPKKRGRPAKAE